MKAARLIGPNDLRMMEIPIPNVGNNDVLIKVKYCGICGTDYSIYSGESSFIEAGLINFPMTMGHEYSGIVETVGRNVKNFKKGDRVVADTGVSCGICKQCREGNYLRCEKMQAVGTVKAIDGGYAEYACMPERHVFHLPDNVTFKEGALVEPIATGLNAVKQGDIKVGENILIIGTGPIGLGAVPFAKLAGAKKVILAGRKDYKLDIGMKLGADITINTVSKDLFSTIMELTDGKGVDVIIESSGNQKMLLNATKMLSSGGRLSMVAFYEEPINNLDIDLLILSDVRLMSVMGSPNLGPIVIDMMETKKIDFNPMISEIQPFDEVEQVLKNFKVNNEKRIKILLEVN